ncbi:MAG: rRNA methyltransferase [Frankiales bacterium]|nr:rRNA methyltransferase [Frankiales bacterium]
MTPNIVAVADPSDPRLDDFRDLMAADAAGRQSLAIAEGVNVVERLLRSPYPVRAVVGVPAKLAALRPALETLPHPPSIYEVDKWTLSEAVGFRVTRGVLAAADRPPAKAAADVIAAGRCFLVLETINDFENLGALFRNAAAFGVNGILLDAHCADPLYRRSVRVSMGHVFAVPFAVLDDPWPASLAGLQAAGVSVLALTPNPQAELLRSIGAPDRWAVLLGAEGPGLSGAALDAADRRVRIPMATGVDSLNVATAAAVALAYLSGSA